MFGFFKKRKEAEQEFFLDLMSGVSYRDNMDRLLATHAIEVASGDGKLAVEVARTVTLITRKTIEIAERDQGSLNNGEIFATQIVTTVAADHVSRLARVSFEGALFAATTALWAGRLAPDELIDLIEEGGKEFNRLAQDPEERQVIDIIGASVAGFFSSANLHDLTPAARALRLLIEFVNETD